MSLSSPSSKDTATNTAARSGTSSFVVKTFGDVSSSGTWYLKTAADMDLHQREPMFMALWMAWLLTGALFYGYAPDFELGFVKGFYMAINIGYSIGFGYPMDTNTHSIWFSTIYVLIGSSFVGVALGFFAEKITEDSETWFTRLQDQKKIEDFILLGIGDNWRGRLRAWWYGHRAALRAVFLWLFLIGILIVVSIHGVGWDFRQAQYFAFTTLSTGGHWMIPEDSPDWLYLVTAGITAVGVPVMGLAMAAIGQQMMDQGDLEDAKTAIDSRVTREELQMLEDLGLEDGDGKIDMAEFICLNMIRVGTDPGLLSYIRQRFKVLSKDQGAEYLTIEDVTQRSCTYSEGKIRMNASLVLEHPEYQEELRNNLSESKQSNASSLPPIEEDQQSPTEEDSHSENEHTSGNRLGDSLSANEQERAPDDMQLSTDSLNAPSTSSDIEEQVTPFADSIFDGDETVVLQPEPNLGPPRPLTSRDDVGLALLDRSYVMSYKEEKRLVKESRRRMHVFLQAAVEDDGWSSRGKIAGTKISTKEGVGGSNCNMIRGYAEVECLPEMQGRDYIEFFSAQCKHFAGDGDRLNNMYGIMDPMCIQLTTPTIVRNRELLDHKAREELVVCWAAVKSPTKLVHDRDFCIVCHYQTAKCPKTGRKGTVFNFFGIVHPSAPDMERALGRVRADVFLGGYFVRPEDEKHLSVTYLAHYDAKGSIPVKVVNAVALSQGLNAGRVRDLCLKCYSVAYEFNQCTAPASGHVVRRFGSQVVDLQLNPPQGAAMVGADTLRTVKVPITAYAEGSGTIKILLTDYEGQPLPFTLQRADRSDKAGKPLARGKAVAFGGKGNLFFSSSLYLQTEGPLPKFLRLKFHSRHWRSYQLAVPGVVQLVDCSAPEPSSTYSDSLR